MPNSQPGSSTSNPHPEDPMQDNSAFRSLFALPPLPASTSTDLIVPAMPEPKQETGDQELDAVLWLRECIGTAHPTLIKKALDAFNEIKTPAKDLEKRYCDYLVRASGGNTMAAIFGGFGFANLKSLAERVTEKQAKKHEALSRFGSVEKLFEDTPAEAACKAALKGLRKKKDVHWDCYDSEKADSRFMKHHELVPESLADCLLALEYGKDLYWLRQSSAEMTDHWPEFQEHADFCFRQLAQIKPRTKDEALSVFEYLQVHDAMDRNEAPSILRNLISGGWQ